MLCIFCGAKILEQWSFFGEKKGEVRKFLAGKRWCLGEKLCTGITLMEKARHFILSGRGPCGIYLIMFWDRKVTFSAKIRKKGVL